MKLYSPSQMRAADKYSIEKLNIPGTVLMDRAADAIFNVLIPFCGKGKRFVILCGKGNNGGDGWALACKLSDMFEKTICISVMGGPSTDDAAYFYRECLRLRDEKHLPIILDASTDANSALHETSCADVVVDAVFGTGFCGDIPGDSIAGRLINAANTSSAYRVAADIPGGADAFCGKCADITFRADTTVTFAKAKPGMYSYPAFEKCGRIIIADIGIPQSVFDDLGSQCEVTDADTIISYLPERKAVSNKGDYGKLLVIAGSENMTGAAHLSLSGALRCGVGLVYFASSPYVTNIIKHRLSEPVFITVSENDEDTDRLVEYSKKCSSVLIGCGLGTDNATKTRVRRLIRECECPIILDADGINAVSDNINIITEAKKGILLTPHPLEFSRISGIELKEISANRLECAIDFSKKYNCTLLLKGAGTVICEKGERLCINPVSCSALAKGGSGDVLAGMIASLSAQGASLYESAVVAAYLHGMAGVGLAREFSEYGVIPSDIPERAARILAEITALKYRGASE